MAKKIQNKRVSFGSKVAHRGRFADIIKGQKINTAKAIDALASIKLSNQERDRILSAIDS